MQTQRQLRSRLKPKNKHRIESSRNSGTLRVELCSVVPTSSYRPPPWDVAAKNRSVRNVVGKFLHCYLYRLACRRAARCPAEDPLLDTLVSSCLGRVPVIAPATLCAPPLAFPPTSLPLRVFCSHSSLLAVVLWRCRSSALSMSGQWVQRALGLDGVMALVIRWLHLVGCITTYNLYMSSWLHHDV